MKRARQGEENTIFVQLILENKEKLFGKHSSKLTSDDKKEIWGKIKSEMVAAGANSLAGKSWNEMSSKFSDLKRKTQDKMVKKKATGGEGRGVQLTEVSNVFIKNVKL
jgi:hypothetical protein